MEFKLILQQSRHMYTAAHEASLSKRRFVIVFALGHLKQLKKITVNTGQVMFSGEIYFYWSLNSVGKSLVKHRFSFYNLLRY